MGAGNTHSAAEKWFAKYESAQHLASAGGDVHTACCLAWRCRTQETDWPPTQLLQSRLPRKKMPSAKEKRSEHIHSRSCTYQKHEDKRGKSRGSSSGDADRLDALQNGYAKEVHVCRAMKLFPQVLEREVQHGVLLVWMPLANGRDQPEVAPTI